ATRSPRLSCTSAMTTRPPSSTNRSAVRLPIPEAPPVTTATLSLMRMVKLPGWVDFQCPVPQPDCWQRGKPTATRCPVSIRNGHNVLAVMLTANPFRGEAPALPHRHLRDEECGRL